MGNGGGNAGASEKIPLLLGEDSGITVSGGEPLLQMEFLLALFILTKEEGIHTCIDTTGQPFSRKKPFFGGFQQRMVLTDLVRLDIKHIDDEGHKVLTGASNANILDMARYLSETGKPVWIRHVLVPQRSDGDEYLREMGSFVRSLQNVEKVEVLPYHMMGRYKWEELGIFYLLEGIEPPKEERVKEAERMLKGCCEYR